MSKYDSTDFLAFLIIIGIVIVLLLVEAIVGVWLWGVIMVGIFGLPALTFWQFYGLIVLLHILLPSPISTKKKD